MAIWDFSRYSPEELEKIKEHIQALKKSGIRIPPEVQNELSNNGERQAILVRKSTANRLKKLMNDRHVESFDEIIRELLDDADLYYTRIKAKGYR
nr:hypothetical protein [uncultured archaeon]